MDLSKVRANTAKMVHAPLFEQPIACLHVTLCAQKHFVTDDSAV